MNQIFKDIGIVGKPRNEESSDTIRNLIQVLTDLKRNILVQDTLGEELHLPQDWHIKPEQMASKCELIIVVGGDGSMLNAARLLAETDVPVMGINRGNLGFLTDIAPTKLVDSVTQIVNGKYRRAKRFLLDCHIYRGEQLIGQNTAFNDVVLFPGEISRMIEFDVAVDGKHLYQQKSDGLIVATPTGSTAYALSGGGPILHPKLDAIALVPICPHTLSSRPIVVDGNSHIEIRVTPATMTSPQVSCDGQVQIAVESGDNICIKKSQKTIHLLHPVDYDYYHILRTKLGWSSKNSH